MTPTETEIRALIALQQEIDAKLDELITRFKALMTANPYKRIIVDIDGSLYELAKVDTQSQIMDSGRKHHGFFSEYRIVALGKLL